MMQEFLELQEKSEKLKKAIKDKEKLIEEKEEKIRSLVEKINELLNKLSQNSSDTRHFKGMVSILENEKKNLEKEKKRLEKELKSFRTMNETMNQTLQTKEESLLSKEQQLQKKNEKLEEFQTKLDELREEKEKYQVEKFKFMENLTNEKIALVEKVGDLEKKQQEDQQKIRNLKKKTKQSQDGLLGASMELERIREDSSKLSAKLQETTNELEDIRSKKTNLEDKVGTTAEKLEMDGKIIIKEKELQKYKEKIAKLELTVKNIEGDLLKSPEKKGSKTIFEKTTGTYTNISALLTHFKFKIGNASRTLRIVIPKLSDIEEYGLLEVLEELPKNVLKNLACAVVLKTDKKYIKKLQADNFRITDYKGKDLFALAINSSFA
ncbi:MAG: hypothetical protein ACTSWL_07840, partial [Promethearchaeota archaeon]